MMRREHAGKTCSTDRTQGRPRNALTIDVEDYWSVFSRDWLGKSSEPSDAVVRNTERFLQIVSDHGVKATFFILGEVAKKFPSLITKIAEQGHEIGVHGYFHKQIFKLTEEEFREEVGDCKKLLEDTISGTVAGHRAPAFSIMPKTKWALEVLAEEGFRYDSSVYPISGKRYGWPGFSKNICKVDLPSGRDIVEVPMSTITVLGKTLPAAGGGYFRHFPYFVTRLAINRIQKRRPVIVYMHPYEIDTEQRALDTDHLSDADRNKTLKFHKLQQRNRNTVAGKLNRLLNEFEFTTLGRVIDKVIAD
jgi:polysaccharide deacetylase family protein (PEP-CTERM system associated)